MGHLVISLIKILDSIRCHNYSILEYWSWPYQRLKKLRILHYCIFWKHMFAFYKSQHPTAQAILQNIHPRWWARDGVMRGASVVFWRWRWQHVTEAWHQVIITSDCCGEAAVNLTLFQKYSVVKWLPLNCSPTPLAVSLGTASCHFLRFTWITSDTNIMNKQWMWISS